MARQRLNSNYNPIKLKGFSELRPEILSVLHFVPAYDDGARHFQRNSSKYMLAAGEKIRVQFALAKLRNKNIKELIGMLREDDAAKAEIDTIESGYDTKIKELEADIKLLSSLFVRLQKANNALNIRKSQPKIKALVGGQAGDAMEAAMYTSILESLGFDRDNISEFSNTKILMQLLYDMGISMAQYSPILLDAENPLRIDDDDPIDIDKNVIDPSLEVFSLESIRAGDIVGGKRKAYWRLASQLFNSLGDSPIMTADNRVRFLLASLVKELRYSSVMGSNSVRMPLALFGVNVIKGGNIFDDILGMPGNTVVDPVGGVQSICTLLRRETTDGTVVLPFESDIFSDEDDSFITGGEFFVDSILSGQQTQMSPKLLVNFITEAEQKNNGLNSILNTLLGQTAAGTSAMLSTNVMLRHLLWGFSEWIGIAANQPSIGGSSAGRIDFSQQSAAGSISNISLGLLVMGSKNSRLKMLLYYYTLLLGLSNLNNAENAFRHPFWQGVATSDLRMLYQVPPLKDDFKGRGPQNNYATVNGVYQPALDKLVDQIIEVMKTVLPQIKPKNVQEEQAAITEANIRQALSTTSGLDAQRNIFSRIGDTVVYMDNEARSGRGILSTPPENSYTLDDGSQRTRFGFMRPAFLVAMMYEIFSSLSEKYGNTMSFASCDPGSGEDDFRFTMFVNADSMRGQYDGLTSVASGTETSGKEAQAVNAQFYRLERTRTLQSMSANKKAMDDDENLPIQILNYINAVMVNVKNETGGLRELTGWDFTPKSMASKQRLQELMERDDATELFATLNPGQLATSVNQIWSLKKTKANPSTDISAFSDPSYLSNNVQRALLSMLREPMFRKSRAENLKIISVGLPAGIRGALQDVVLEDDDNPGPARERDVVQINIYKRDLEFDDIVFKPMSFLFELSRFTRRAVQRSRRAPRGGISRMRFLPHAGKSIVADHIWTLDFQIDEDFVFPVGWKGVKREGYYNVAAGDDYSFLNVDEKRDMFKNHVVSSYLELYIRFMTDMEIREETFLLNDQVAAKKADAADRERFIKLMLTRVTALAGRPVTLDELKKGNPQMGALLDKLDNDDKFKGVTEKIQTNFTGLSDGTNIEIAEDVVNFVKAFSPQSLLTGANVTADKIISPKIFERIFHVPVDIDDFEVDVEATLSTNAGRRAWKNKAFREILVTHGTGDDAVIKMKARQAANGDHITTEMFATISTRALEDDIS